MKAPPQLESLRRHCTTEDLRTTVTQNLEMEYANTFQINLALADNKVPDIK